MKRGRAGILGILTCAFAFAFGPASQAQAACDNVFGTVSVQTTFVYCGGEQSLTLPPFTGAVQVIAVGAKGADGYMRSGGLGGKLSATVAIPPSVSTLYVEVGGPGGAPSGGFNGGGSGVRGAGGGGGSDVRTIACAPTCPGVPDSPSLASRLIAAAGGGGVGGCPNGGHGGSGPNGEGANGGFGICDYDEPAAGRGATQTAPGAGGTSPYGPGGDGSLGQGGSTPCGGGGGGGWYGGGGGALCAPGAAARAVAPRAAPCTSAPLRSPRW